MFASSFLLFLYDIHSRSFVGWISCRSVVYVFLKAFLFYLCVCFVLFMFSPSLFKLLHLQSNKTHVTTTQQQQQQRLGENRTTNRNIKKCIVSQPEPERYLFAVGSWAGYPVFLLFLLFLLFSKLFYLISVCLFVCFSVYVSA